VLPPPPLRPLPSAEVRGDWIGWRIASGHARDLVELPADFYLRELMELDPGDLEGVAELCRSYGKPFGWGFSEVNIESYDHTEYDRIKAIPEGGHAEGDPLWVHGYHKDYVRLHLEIAQGAIRTWIALQTEGGVEELVEPGVTDDELRRIQEENADAGELWPADLDNLRKLLIDTRIDEFKETLNAALREYSVGIGDLSEKDSTIYSCSFLQLYNHMAEESVFRRCASETCRCVFVRQRGRAKFDQHRTEGVLYCSRECARAQAQRQLRRRRKQENGTGMPTS